MVKKKRGFTLIELLITMVVIAIISFSVGLVLREAFLAEQSSFTLLQGNGQMRIALERLSRDLRLISAADSSNLTITPSSEITFLTINGDTVRYFLSTGNLMRQNNGGGAQLLAQNISALQFSYFDKFALQTTNPNDVVSVSVTMTSANISSGSFQTLVSLR